MAINRNNFLRWNGNQTPSPFTNVAANDGPFLMPSGDLSVNCDILSNDSATLGINPATVTILSYSATTQLPAEFVIEGSTNYLTVYRPTDPTVSSLTITYQWQDYCGNVSPVATITVNVLTAATAWIGYAPSYVCLLNPVNGQNSGYANFTQQVLVYSPSDTPVSPLTLRPNVVSLGTDYIGPVQDLVSCPSSAGLYAPINIANFVNRAASFPQAFITMTEVVVIYSCNPFTGAAGTFSLTYPVSIGPGQSIQLVIPINWQGPTPSAGTMDVSVSFTVGGPGGAPYGSPIDWLDYLVNTGLVTPYTGYFTTGGGSPVPGAFLAPAGGNFDFGSGMTLNYPAGATLYIA